MAEDNTQISVREKEELTNSGEETGGEETREGRFFKPAVDIFETEDALQVVADVPGADPDSFDIDVRDSMLTITATCDALESRWKPVYEEYRTGNFMRRFRLGQQIDQSKIAANVNNGVLELTLPKGDQARPRKIEVSTG